MKKSVKSTKVAPTPAKAAKSAVVTKTVPRKKALVNGAKSKAGSDLTTITARIDIGFGNALYVRGDGPGLSWHKGIPLDCVSDDKWSITLKGGAKPFVFKFLVNDLSWSAGPDYVAEPGSDLIIVPTF